MTSFFGNSESNFTIEFVEKCLNSGADINERSPSGKTLLAIAMDNGLIDLAEHLINRGAKVNLIYRSQWTICHSAAANTNPFILGKLMEKQANFKPTGINEQEFSFSVLDAACEANNIENAKWLLEHQPFSDDQVENGIHFAMCNGHVEVVEFLLSKIKTPSPELLKAMLEIASIRGFDDLASLALSRGADVNAKDELGKTPLIHAWQRGYNNLIKLYLKNNVDLERTFFQYSANLVGLAQRPELIQRYERDYSRGTSMGKTSFHNQTLIYPEISQESVTKEASLLYSGIKPAKAVMQVIHRIEKIKGTTYGLEKDKQNKIQALESLVDMLLESKAQPVTELIALWKEQKIDEHTTNWEICSSHKRDNPLLSFFRQLRGRTTAQLIDGIIEHSNDYDADLDQNQMTL